MLVRFLYNFLNYAHLALQKPSELPVQVERDRDSRSHVIAAIVLISVAQATGAYFLRDYYDSGYWIAIPVYALVYAAVTGLWAAIFGAIIDSLVARSRRERAGRAWSMATIIVFSALPNAFVIAVATIARFVDQPILIAAPAYLGIFVWSMLISLRGLQYLYELSLPTAIRLYLGALAITLGFPAAVALFLGLRLAQAFV